MLNRKEPKDILGFEAIKEDFEALNRLGEELKIKEDYAAALTCFETALVLALPSIPDKCGQIMQNLGDMYFNGYGVLQSNARAFEYYTKANQLGIVASHFSLAELYIKSNSSAKAIAELNKGAKHKNIPALQKLGDIYRLGLLDEKVDLEKANGYYQQSHALGCPEARENITACGRIPHSDIIGFNQEDNNKLVQLGLEFLEKKDYPGALTCFELAAKSNFDSAFNQLACMYSGVSGFSVNLEKALHYHKLALEKNTSGTRSILLGNVGHTLAIMKKIPEAIAYLDEAIFLADPEAMVKMADILENDPQNQCDFLEAAAYHRYKYPTAIINRLERRSLFYPYAYIGLIRCYRTNLEKLKEFAELFLQNAQSNPDPWASYYHYIQGIMAWEYESNTIKALEHFHQAKITRDQNLNTRMLFYIAGIKHATEQFKSKGLKEFIMVFRQAEDMPAMRKSFLHEILVEQISPTTKIVDIERTTTLIKLYQIEAGFQAKAKKEKIAALYFQKAIELSVHLQKDFKGDAAQRGKFRQDHLELLYAQALFFASDKSTWQKAFEELNQLTDNLDAQMQVAEALLTGCLGQQINFNKALERYAEIIAKVVASKNNDYLPLLKKISHTLVPIHENYPAYINEINPIFWLLMESDLRKTDCDERYNIAKRLYLTTARNSEENCIHSDFVLRLLEAQYDKKIISLIVDPDLYQNQFVRSNDANKILLFALASIFAQAEERKRYNRSYPSRDSDVLLLQRFLNACLEDKKKSYYLPGLIQTYKISDPIVLMLLAVRHVWEDTKINEKDVNKIKAMIKDCFMSILLEYSKHTSIAEEIYSPKIALQTKLMPVTDIKLDMRNALLNAKLAVKKPAEDKLETLPTTDIQVEEIENPTPKKETKLSDKALKIYNTLNSAINGLFGVSFFAAKEAYLIELALQIESQEEDKIGFMLSLAQATIDKINSNEKLKSCLERNYKAFFENLAELGLVVKSSSLRTLTSG